MIFRMLVPHVFSFSISVARAFHIFLVFFAENDTCFGYLSPFQKVVLLCHLSLLRTSFQSLTEFSIKHLFSQRTLGCYRLRPSFFFQSSYYLGEKKNKRVNQGTCPLRRSWGMGGEMPVCKRIMSGGSGCRVRDHHFLPLFPPQDASCGYDFCLCLEDAQPK